MKMTRLLILLLLTWILPIIVANACKCDDLASVKEAYKGAHLVMLGKVMHKTLVSFAETINPKEVPLLEKELGPSRKPEIHDQSIVKIELAVTQLFKGKVTSKTVIIYTPFLIASCGFSEFKVGESFVIYASRWSFLSGNFTEREGLEKVGTFWTHRCSRTSIARQEEITQLKKISLKK